MSAPAIARGRAATQVGTVVAAYRYPVKSMGALSLPEAEIGWHGLQDDRRFAFVQSENRTAFPWLTIRQVPALTAYTPLAGEDPPAIRSPDGRELALDSPELAAELAQAHGAPVHLLRSHRGLFDVFTVSLLTVQTVAALGDLVGRPLHPLRFRPNLLIDAPGRADFPEDALVGRLLALGSGDDAALVRVNVRDPRCAIVNFDHRTGTREPEVLRAVAAHRDACLGVYGVCERPGSLRVGDPVWLLDD
jgi:uncharacterized protein YcbX